MLDTPLFVDSLFGAHTVEVVGTDGGSPRQLTHGPYDHREPRFSPDGARLVFSSDVGGSYGIHTLDLRTGAISR